MKYRKTNFNNNLHTMRVVGGGVVTVLLSLILIVCCCSIPVHAATTSNNTKISSGTLSNGTITPSKTNATAGTTVTFTITPASGYKMKPGSLYYTKDGVKVTLTDTTRSITVPNSWTQEVWEEDTCESCSTSCSHWTCDGTYWCDICMEYHDDCYCDTSTESCSEYDCSGYVTKTYYVGSIVLYAEFILDKANYTINHYQEQFDGTYQLISSETQSGTINSSVNSSMMKRFIGFSISKLVEGL